MKLKKQTQKQTLLTLLFWPWFVFLSIAVFYIATLQSDREVDQTRSYIIQGLNDVADKAEIITRNEERSNRFFIVSHQRLLEKFVIKKLSATELWEAIEQEFDSNEGVLIYSEFANPVFEKNSTSGPLRRVISLPELKNKPAMGLSLKTFDGDIFYYAYSRFYVGSRAYYLIVERPFENEFLDYIASAQHKFEFSLTNAGTTAIRSASFKKEVSNKDDMRLFASQEVQNLGWKIDVYQHKDYPVMLLIDRLKIGALILVVLLLLYVMLKVVLRFYQKRHKHVNPENNYINAHSQTLLDRIDEIIVSTDSKSVIGYINDQGAQFLGEPARSLLGRRLNEVYPDKQAIWNKPVKGEKGSQPHYLNLTIGGQDRFYEQGHQAIQVDKDEIKHLWTLKDVTEKKQHLDLLNNTKQRYQSIFEGSGSAHVLLERNDNSQSSVFTIFDANNAALKLFNIASFADMTERSHTLLKQNDELVKNIKSQNQTGEFQTSITDLSGQTKKVWAHVYIDSANSNRLLLTLLDISESNPLFKSSAEDEGFWSQVIQAMPDFVYVSEFDEQGNIGFAKYKNSSLEAVLGYSDKNIDIKNWTQFLLDEDLAKVSDILSSLKQLKPGEKHSATLRFYDVHHQLRYIRFQNRIFEKHDNGRVRSVVGIARDITQRVNRQQKVIDSEKHYRLVAENINDVIFSTDTNLNLNFISASVERMFGHTSEYLIAKGLKNLFPLSVRESIITGLEQQLVVAADKASNQQPPVTQDVTLLNANAQPMLIELQTSALFEDETLVGILGVCRDVSQVRQSQQQLALAAKVFESSNEAIIITDNKLNIVSSNKSFTTITGYKNEQVLGKNIEFLISSEGSSSQFIKSISRYLQQTGYWQGEVFYTCSKGHRRIGWVGVSAVKDEAEKIQSLIMIISDVTERKAIEDRIHRLAYYDPLTGLPNRTHLHENLKRILSSAEKEYSNVILLFIDLDRFKPINDSMGHPAGDQVLKQVADRLRDCTKRQDLVCRIGGDEFTVIIENQGSAESATENAMLISERLLESLNEPYFINNRELFLSASIGIAVYPSDGLSVTELIKNSDLAMYHAKNNGRGNIQFFNKAMNQVAIESMELENDLRQALTNDEFELYYQPQYSSDDCSMIAVEALIRWHHPTKGMIYPGLFIHSLEETGMIVEVGRWVLEQACLQFAQWLNKDTDSHLEHVSVNVSARQFKQDNFLEQIKNALIKSNIEASHLEIELTESVLVDDIEHTFKMLTALRDLGVKIAIDDFGTGYSSLNYLKRFPFDTLKIDQNFVRELPGNQDDVQITRAIIALAKNMKVDVVAEGVETKEQLDFLSEQNCNKIQGYLFEPPLPAAKLFKRFLNNQHTQID